MNRHHTIWAFASALAFAACATEPAIEPGDGTATGTDGAQGGNMSTMGADPERLVSEAPIAAVNGISNSGGQVMHGTPTLYFIFYGNWGTIPTNTSWGIFADWAKNLGGSAYYGINTSYYDSSGDHVLNALSYGGFWYDNGYSQGKSLNDTNIKSIVQSTIDNNHYRATSTRSTWCSAPATSTTPAAPAATRCAPPPTTPAPSTIIA